MSHECHIPFQAAGPGASDEASLHIRVVEDLLFLSGLHGFHGFHWPKIDIRPLSTAKTIKNHVVYGCSGSSTLRAEEKLK